MKASVAASANPDRVATTLAILRVEHEAHQSYLGGYLPFLYHCLRLASDGDQIAAREVQRQLQTEFSLELPLGVIKSLLRDAVAEGKVREKRKTYFRIPEALEGCSLDEERGHFGREFGTLAQALVAFDKAPEEEPWTIDQAKEHLIAYADSFSSDVLAAAISGGTTGSEAPHQLSPEMYVVHRFAAAVSASDAVQFNFLVGLVKARMLADSLYFDIALGQEEQLKNLDVYFDGPVLLFSLAYAGTEIAASYQELLTMLVTQGARLRCFRHSLMEAQQILDAAAAAMDGARQQQRFYGDVVGYLVRSDISRTDIELHANNLEADLADLGIETVDTPGRSADLQPDEVELQDLIKSYIPGIKAPALVRDVDSLTAIHRLRRGRTPRTLASSEAVMVTHNYALFRASARFFKQRGGGKRVPHCVYDASFVTLVWLLSPKQFPDLPREIVLADASAALTPRQVLWDRYNDEAQRLFERGDIDEMALQFLRFSEDAQTILMDLTRGRSDAFTEGTMQEVLALYRERETTEIREEAQAEEERLRAEAIALEEQLTSEKRELAQRLEEARLDHERQASALADEAADERGRLSAAGTRVDALASTIARVVSLCGLVVVAALLLTGTIFGPIGPAGDFLPLALQIPCAMVAFTAGFASVVFGGSLKSWFGVAEARLGDRLSGAMRRFLRL
jgi:hypothetical protein